MAIVVENGLLLNKTLKLEDGDLIPSIKDDEIIKYGLYLLG